MDRPIEPLVLKRKKRMRIAAAAGMAVMLVLVTAGALQYLRPSVARERISTAVVERGTVLETVSASGIVVPELEYVVTCPISTTIVKILRHPGDVLAPGDSLLLLDTEASRLALGRISEQIRLNENRAAQAAIDLAIKLNDLESQRENRKLRLASAESVNRQAIRLYDLGGVSRDRLDESELAVQIARIELVQVEQAIANAKRLTENSLAGIEMEKRILEQERSENALKIEQARTAVDRVGVLTWIVEDVGGSVSPGQVIARIADLQSYRVEATVSEVHASKLTTGLPVIVKLADGTRLDGRIESIMPTIESGIVSFTATLDSKNDTRLRSNLRAEVSLVTAAKDSVLRIKTGPFAQGYGISEVFVVEGNRARKREVTFGLAGIDWLEILDGLADGEEVIVSDMRERLYADELLLK